MDALTEVRKDMDKLKKENAAENSNVVHNNAPLPLSSTILAPVSQESPAGFSGFRSPSMEASSEEEELQGDDTRCQELWGHGKCRRGT
ncbi:hypothetical protein E2C01_022946 [Portunus trituberculatus]|uniref:Uncharacterized protein n=1 Tax=Portunus trituberculatus TaxID=210409 RepID=A0A5B7E6Q1_PORTR|nr:hypothetical protein [Portunus trituberculatus]